MTKSAYIGVADKARKITGMYIGVDGVARKVTKAYVGVNGIAQEFWSAKKSIPAILKVQKITSDTYAAETTYTGESFILLDIYPKTNGTVKVTYGGLTKTITDTSGAAEPNAQQVFFGTFNGVSDSVTTPDSGELMIEGDFYAFGRGSYTTRSGTKNTTNYYKEFTSIESFGNDTIIPDQAFNSATLTTVNLEGVTEIGNGAFANCSSMTIVGDEIPEGVTKIGRSAFSMTEATGGGEGLGYFITAMSNRIILPSTLTHIGHAAFADDIYSGGYGTYLKTVIINAVIPPTIDGNNEAGEMHPFGDDILPTITVPKGCGETYKAAEGWSTYAAYIVEVS